jgi:cytoskeleton protein RodZ
MSLDLMQIGQRLREEREERAISLDDVSEALLVRKSVVAALESGKWELLPHFVYVKGYVRQYARYLGLDHDFLQELFSKFLSQ